MQNKKIYWMLFVALIWARSGLAQDFEPFTVSDVRVEGLQRVPVSQAYRAINIDAGDEVTQRRAQVALKRLFATGDFQDVRLDRDGDQLLFVVSERPSISKLSISGNKSIETKDLEEGLRQEGLAQGSVMQRATLDRIRRGLERQYLAQGRYGAKVEAELIPRPRNRVEIKITIYEGAVAKISKINLIGNNRFSDEALKDLFELKEPHLLAFIKGNNKYARERFAGDLERLRSFYLDRGYVQFAVESTQVSIDSDKERVYLTVNVREGEQFKVDRVDFAGKIPLEESELEALLGVKSGETFSRLKLTQTEDAIVRKLGDAGYSFATVRGVPDIDPEKNLVNITFLVEPQKRVSVRRIEFQGQKNTADHVMRREMRQMESAWASTEKIELSKIRLQRLGFFKGVSIETPQVPGSDDLIDLNVTLEEQPSGSLGASVGYQGGAGVVFGANLSQRNFLGTGNEVELVLQRTALRNTYRFEFLDPYFTIDGVSRGFNFYFSETDYSELDLSRYRLDAKGVNVRFGYPISEKTRLNFSLGFDDSRVYAQGGPANTRSDTRVLNFIDYPDPNVDSGRQSQSYLTYVGAGNWRRSSLNKGLLPDRGTLNSISMEFGLPGADLEYYRVNYLGDFYMPLSDRFTLRLRTELGFGDGYGETDRLPFYKNYFSGGLGSIRGFETRSLGPLDDTIPADPFGGNLLTETSFELIFPAPFVKDKRTVRTAFFIDAGNVFDTERVDGTYDFDVSDFRYSAGLGFTWITGIGPLSFTFAKAFNESETDQTQSFDFSLGTIF